jgi:hypothetical protein
VKFVLLPLQDPELSLDCFHNNRIAKDGTEGGVRYSRGAREAIATVVKVAGISTSDIKAEELDSPLAGVQVW